MSLYALLLIATIAGPLALSFDKKVHFYTSWKPLLIALIPVNAFFLIWDEFFTQNGIWGFNSEYLSGIFLGSLPLEEVLFFFIVPYACIFIYEVLNAYFPGLNLSVLGKIVGFSFVFSGLMFGLLYMDNCYTATACILSALLTIGAGFVYQFNWYPRFVFMYLVALVPFTIVNGFLTGMATENPVVWYSAEHIIGIRIITIPLEDLYYNYSLLIMIVWLMEMIKKRSINRADKSGNP
jgi:lycopene cyclase domain-containing protein